MSPQVPQEDLPIAADRSDGKRRSLQETELYETLSQSATGDLVGDLYLDNRRRLTAGTREGAEVAVRDVSVAEVCDSIRGTSWDSAIVSFPWCWGSERAVARRSSSKAPRRGPRVGAARIRSCRRNPSPVSRILPPPVDATLGGAGRKLGGGKPAATCRSLIADVGAKPPGLQWSWRFRLEPNHQDPEVPARLRERA